MVVIYNYYITTSLFISHAFTPMKNYSPKRQFINYFHYIRFKTYLFAKKALETDEQFSFLTKHKAPSCVVSLAQFKPNDLVTMITRCLFSFSSLCFNGDLAWIVVYKQNFNCANFTTHEARLQHRMRVNKRGLLRSL